jgi:zinc transporter 9
LSTHRPIHVQHTPNKCADPFPLHSQSLLLLGIKSSAKAPDAQYNYGYRRERFVWSLISAVGVFFMGSGVSVAHGVHSLWYV